jgi:hypothetical protein
MDSKIEMTPGYAIVSLAHGMYDKDGNWTNNCYGYCEVSPTELRTEGGAKWVLIVRKHKTSSIGAIIPGCQIRAITFTTSRPQKVSEI